MTLVDWTVVVIMLAAVIAGMAQGFSGQYVRWVA